MANNDITLYGIPNCDQVRKARAWLDERGVAYRFHDFKKHGVSVALISTWQQAVGWDVLLNRKGTTWRGLTDADRAAAQDAASAALLMSAHPSLIRRPVLCIAGHCHTGFVAADYQTIFKGEK